VADLARGEAGVGELAHAQGDVDAFLDQVDVAVVQHEVDVELRMLFQEQRQARQHVQAREGHRGADAQAAGEGGGCAAGGALGFVGFLDRALGALVEAAARFGGRQAVGRSQQQAHAEAVFQLGDGLGDGRLSHAQQSGGAGEGAGFDDADEGFHRGQAVHGYSPSE